jgi:hypothetical protein
MPDIFPITDWQSFTASDFSELNVNPLPPDPQFGLKKKNCAEKAFKKYVGSQI